MRWLIFVFMFYKCMHLLIISNLSWCILGVVILGVFADITEFLLLIIIIFLDIMPNAKLMPLKLERVYAGLCTITVIVQKVLNNQIVMLLSNFHSSYICKLIEITYHRARTSFD